MRAFPLRWLLFVVLLVPALFHSALSLQSWVTAQPGFEWDFPRDHWTHREYRTEWWYFTGHLSTADASIPLIAYQFTFFRNGVLPSAPKLASNWASGHFLMGHAAISIPSREDHRFSEVLYREVPMLAGFGTHPDPLIAWSRGPAGTAEQWALRWNGTGFDFEMSDRRQNFRFSLATQPAKPRVFQGPAGFSRKEREGPGGSLYYSFTRLETRGEISVDGRTFPVRGLSWMDKEFSSSMLAAEQTGWDWFGLQLNEGSELMLYRLRDSSGKAGFSSGTLVSADGTVNYLDPDDRAFQVSDWWSSPETDIRYPVGWFIDLPEHNLNFRVEAAFDDQENRSQLIPHLDYWEGSVRVFDRSGRQVGQGFMELTGYGPQSRPPI